MKLISDTEAGEWLGQHGHRLLSPDERVHPDRYGNKVVRIEIPHTATEVAGMAYSLLTLGLADDDEARFLGGILWLREWEIWSESIDRVGYQLLEGVRAVSGDDANLFAKPGFLFGGDEFVRAHAALVIPMLFQWDAIMAPPAPSFHVRISHDGYIDVAYVSAETRAALIQRFPGACVQLPAQSL